MPDFSALRSPTQEIALVDLVERLENHRKGRFGVHIYLSRLSPAFRREAFLRIASQTFGTAMTGFDGQIFLLQNSDILFVGRDLTLGALQASVGKLRTLFAEDPLLLKPVSEITGRDLGALCTYYNLEVDYDALLADAKALLQEADKARLDTAQGVKPLAADPIRPDLLTKLENLLSKVDVAAVLRRQTVCTLIENEAPQPIFDETYISIDDLESMATPGTDLMGNCWLFRYLTETLDQRMMTTLMRDGVGANARPFSINLNVSSVLSPLFAKFEAVVTPQLRGRLVIEMNKLDVFSDMNAFLFARDYLRDRGFRLCLDGLTHHTLPFYDRDKLGFDLVKINWTPDSVDTMLENGIPALRGLVRETGVAHTILCHCDDETAIAVGRDLGIVMFQGHQVDKLMKEPPPVKHKEYVLRYREREV